MRWSIILTLIGFPSRCIRARKTAGESSVTVCEGEPVFILCASATPPPPPLLQSGLQHLIHE